jgi:hypothetical protein
MTHRDPVRCRGLTQQRTSLPARPPETLGGWGTPPDPRQSGLRPSALPAHTLIAVALDESPLAREAGEGKEVCAR